MKNVDLTLSNMMGVIFKDATCPGVKFEEVNFEGADLTYASLEKANFQNAFFLEANLHGTNLTGANLKDAFFVDANLFGPWFEEKDSPSKGNVGFAYCLHK